MGVGGGRFGYTKHPGRLCAKAVLPDGQREMGEACGDEGLRAGLCQAAGPRSLGRG